MMGVEWPRASCTRLTLAPLWTRWRDNSAPAGVYWPEGAAMTSIAAGDGAQLGPAAENTGRRRAAGIYGAIITAAILDTIGGHASTTVLVISVVVTLLVYWIADDYAGGLRGAPGLVPGAAGRDRAVVPRPPPPAAGGGAGHAGRGLRAHRRECRAGGGDRAADGPRLAGWPGRPAAAWEAPGSHLDRGR